MLDKIDSSVEQIINKKSIVAALCHSLSGIARSDGPITLNEYNLLTNAMRKLGSLSDNPALISIYTYQGIVEDTPLDESIRLISMNNHLMLESTRVDVFEILIPIISAQLHPDQIYSNIIQALNIKDNTPKSSFNKLTLKKLFGVGHLIHSKQHASFVESFAWRYNQIPLYNHLKHYRQHDTNEQFLILNKKLQESKKNILHSVKAFKQSLELVCQQNSTTSQLTKLADSLYEQVQQRLNEIERRATLQKKIFKEDIDAYITQSVNEVELNLRHCLDDQDWTNPDIWKAFSETEAAQSLTSHYEKLQLRYEEIFAMWEQEFNTFSKELILTRKIILQGLEKQALTELIQPPSSTISVLDKLDTASSFIVNSLKMASAGSLTIGGIAIATGVPASLFLVSATTVGSFIISSPLGWTTIGTITLAGLYQYFTNPKKRKVKVIKDKRILIEEGLKKMMGYPHDTHDSHMNEIVKNFQETAEKNFAPLIRDTRLAVIMNDLQMQAINKINESTLNELEQIKLSPSESIS